MARLLLALSQRSSSSSGQSQFSGPMTAQTVFPDGVGMLPQARHNDATIARPETRSPPRYGSS
jgi:hypothetical protein